MARKRIFNILKKEWRVTFAEFNTLFMVTLLPLLIVGELLLDVWLIATFAGEKIMEFELFQNAVLGLQTVMPGITGLADFLQLRVYLLTQFTFFLLLIPTMIAVNLATFSIIDEKLSGSLEALLATPVRTWELLLGKVLAGAIPAVIMTWVSAGVLLAAVALMGWGNIIGLVVNPVWFLSLFLLAPVITVMSFLLGVIGSSRARDAKGAQNYVILIVLPMLALVVVQVTGLVWFTTLSMLLLVVGIAILDFLVLRIAVGLFQRDSIVAKWR